MRIMNLPKFIYLEISKLLSILTMYCLAIQKYAKEAEDKELKQAAWGCLWELAEGIEFLTRELNSTSTPRSSPEPSDEQSSKESEYCNSVIGDSESAYTIKEQELHRNHSKVAKVRAEIFTEDEDIASKTLEFAKEFCFRPRSPRLAVPPLRRPSAEETKPSTRETVEPSQVVAVVSKKFKDAGVDNSEVPSSKSMATSKIENTASTKTPIRPIATEPSNVPSMGLVGTESRKIENSMPTKVTSIEHPGGLLTEAPTSSTSIVNTKIKNATSVRPLSPNGHLMISYCWSSKDLVKRVVENLKVLPIEIWFDENEMHGSLLDRMAEAVERSRAVLICYSQDYKGRQNCRSEAQYAYKCKKAIIPVRCQENYDADGWLGLMLGMHLYYDLSSEQSFNANLPKLMDEIKRAMRVSEPANLGSKTQVDGTQKIDDELKAFKTSPGIQQELTEALPRSASNSETAVVKSDKLQFQPRMTGKDTTSIENMPKNNRQPIPPINREDSLHSVIKFNEKWSVADVQLWLEREKLSELKDR